MNKKKIITSAAILTSGILLFNPLSVKATVCNGTYTYYFSEATSETETGSRNSSYETCFTIEGARLTSMNGSTASTMTVADCERYMRASQERDDSGLSHDNEFCDEYGNCLNSGVENQGGNFNRGFVDYSGGCKNFINDFSIDSNATISTNVSTAVANECKKRGGIAIAIDRNYTYTNNNASSMYRDDEGNKWNFIPNVINANFTFEVDGECPNTPKTPETEACVSSTGDQKITMGCNGNASASGKYSKNLNGEKSVDIKTNKDAISVCGNIASIISKSSGNFYENGYGQASFGNANYAGGGAKITFNFNTTSTWKWCGSDVKNGHAGCERKEISVCPDEYDYNSSTKKCEKEIVSYDYDHDDDVEKEDCKGNNQSYNAATKVCTTKTETTTTVTEAPCTTYDTYTCDDEDIKTADDIAFENAGKESKTMSANGTATSRDSNDEKDTTMYRIEKGGADTDHEAGKFTSSGGGGGSWSVGTSRSGSVSFGIYNSCIGIYNPFKVRYDEGGQCTDLEIEGGNKYYIPLKAKTGTFPFEATVDDVSILTGLKWNLEVSCDISFTQKMFGEKKYDYRPIDMSNPFPKSLGKIENMPSNWQLFMSKEDLINKYMNRENIEYIGNLTVEDIRAIKQKSNATPYKYSNLKSISPEGKSSLLDTFNGVTREENNYNNLGKCEKDCW